MNRLLSLISSFLVSDVSESLKSNERCEQISHFAHQKWATMSDLIRSGCSEEMSNVSESLVSLTKNEQMSELLIVLSELLIRSFLDKKRVIHSEIKWANSQPWLEMEGVGKGDGWKKRIKFPKIDFTNSCEPKFL